MVLGLLTMGLIGLGLYGMSKDTKRLVDEHAKEIKKAQPRVEREAEEQGRVNYKDATDCRIQYALDNALFPGEPISTTYYALKSGVMYDDEIIEKVTGKPPEHKSTNVIEHNACWFKKHGIPWWEQIKYIGLMDRIGYSVNEDFIDDEIHQKVVEQKKKEGLKVRSF